jgi:hypothetical protein
MVNIMHNTDYLGIVTCDVFYVIATLSFRPLFQIYAWFGQIFKAKGSLFIEDGTKPMTEPF